jgi:hypothetical protein
MPEHLSSISTNNNNTSEPIINKSLFNYLSVATKAAEQYSEIWSNMCKITHLYGSLDHHELTEICGVFKLSASNISLDTDISEIQKLSKGGNCVIKVGDIFSRQSVDSLYILSLCFNEVYIYKPLTTPAISSTKYVVCKDFKMINSDYLKSSVVCGVIYTRRINNNFMNAVIEANSVLGQQQLEAINNTITLIEQGKKKEKIEALKRQQAMKCAEWCKRFGESSFNYKQSDVGDI